MLSREAAKNIQRGDADADWFHLIFFFFGGGRQGGLYFLKNLNYFFLELVKFELIFPTPIRPWMIAFYLPVILPPPPLQKNIPPVETCGLVETGRLVDTANAMHQFI